MLNIPRKMGDLWHCFTHLLFIYNYTIIHTVCIYIYAYIYIYTHAFPSHWGWFLIVLPPFQKQTNHDKEHIRKERKRTKSNYGVQNHCCKQDNSWIINHMIILDSNHRYQKSVFHIIHHLEFISAYWLCHNIHHMDHP